MTTLPPRQPNPKRVAAGKRNRALRKALTPARPAPPPDLALLHAAAHLVLYPPCQERIGVQAFLPPFRAPFMPVWENLPLSPRNVLLDHWSRRPDRDSISRHPILAYCRATFAATL